MTSVSVDWTRCSGRDREGGGGEEGWGGGKLLRVALLCWTTAVGGSFSFGFVCLFDLSLVPSG